MEAIKLMCQYIMKSIFFFFFFFENERRDFIELDLPKWSNHFELQKIKTEELPPSIQHIQRH